MKSTFKLNNFPYNCDEDQNELVGLPLRLPSPAPSAWRPMLLLDQNSRAERTEEHPALRRRSTSRKPPFNVEKTAGISAARVRPSQAEGTI